MMSLIFGVSKLFSITFSKPDPIETNKKTWGIMPINVAKKKLVILTLKIVGKILLNCHGTPPIKR